MWFGIGKLEEHFLSQTIVLEGPSIELLDEKVLGINSKIMSVWMTKDQFRPLV